MGNKVSPRAIRLKVSQPFDVTWYADNKQFSSILREDLKLRSFIEKKLESAGLLRLVINRLRDSIEFKIFCIKPAFVVGKRGAGIEDLSKEIRNLTGKEVKFSISDVRKLESCAAYVAKEFGNELKKKRVSPRRVMKKLVQNAKRSGALGIRVECSGRLACAEIARTEWYQEGAVPRQTFKADVDYCAQGVNTPWGTCGVKVWIYKGDVIGDDIAKNLGFVKKVENA